MSKEPVLYLSGPMSGLPDNGYPAFHAAAERLRRQGYCVENPAENEAPPCKSWEGYMRIAVKQLAKCDAIVLLPGWEKSRGATLEQFLAVSLGMKVFRLHEI